MENKFTSSDASSALAVSASDHVQIVVSEPVIDARNVDPKLSLQQVACPPQYLHRPALSDPGSPSTIVAGFGSFDLPLESEDSSHAVPLERVRPRLASAFFLYFLCGWGDGVTGTVLPYLKDAYNLTYMTTSLLFVASTMGFFTATLIVERIVKLLGSFYLLSNSPSYLPAFPLASKLINLIRSPGAKAPNKKGTGYSATQGRFVTLVLASLVHSSAFVALGFKAGFPSAMLAFAIAAFSRGFFTTMVNSYVASTPGKGLGFLLGFWSFGGFLSPFVCQSLIASGMPWPRFYLGSLSVSAVNVTLVIYAFRSTQAEFEREKRDALCLISRTSTGTSVSELKAAPSLLSVDAPPPANTLRRVLSTPYQWAFSFFAFLQYGCETTVVGLMVSFLLAARHADPKTVGYVASGFWAGMSIGRWLWGHYSPLMTLSQRRYVILASVYFVMNILICFTKNAVANAVCMSIIGSMSGPVFPGLLALANDVLPNEIHMISMAILCAFAGVGAALLPFLTGLIASLKGIGVFPYITTAQSASTLIVWFLLPSKKPTTCQVNV